MKDSWSPRVEAVLENFGGLCKQAKQRAKTLRRFEELRLRTEARNTRLRNSITEASSIAHVLAQSGFFSPFAILQPSTPPHPSKPLQQFTHVMPASGIVHSLIGFS